PETCTSAFAAIVPPSTAKATASLSAVVLCMGRVPAIAAERKPANEVGRIDCKTSAATRLHHSGLCIVSTELQGVGTLALAKLLPVPKSLLPSVLATPPLTTFTPTALPKIVSR